MTKLAALIGMALALVLPAGAAGAVTIGSNLGRAPDGIMSSEGCSPPCTIVQDTLSADRQAPGGLASPVNGTVVLWRLRVGGSTTPTSLRVIRHMAGGQLTGAGTSSSVTPALNSQSAFPTSLPIGIGDSIGIDCCQPVAEYFIGSGGFRSSFSPVLADGGPGRTGSVSGPKEIALNADIEPTSSIDAATLQSKKRGKVLVTMSVPNPGLISVSGKLVKQATAQAAGPGQVAVAVKPTKRARSRLAEKRKLKTKLTLAFTPTGGALTTLVSKAKLKR